MTKYNKQAGFTLVELAIVMIIIGLLIGGVLKGQELIANAQATATVAQIKGYDTAMSTFREKYSTLPGDINNPNARLRDCNAAPCSTAGDFNGRITQAGAALGTAPAIAQEGVTAFVHMAAADLISDVQLNGTLNFGSAVPEAKVGGGFWMGFTPDGAANGGFAAGDLRPGHYLVMNGVPTAATGALNGAVNPTIAGQLDRKLDDGDPLNGAVRATGTGCVNAGIYDEANEGGVCSMYFRVQV